MTKCNYSIITPVYNEEKILPELYRRINGIMEKVGATYEVILVDDGSKDKSLEIMKGLYQMDHRVKVISFSRNFGQQTAITAGINFAQGEAAIILDADLQDPPELIGKMIEKWKEGYEVIYAVRKRRKENLFKRTAYTLFYRLLKRLSPIDIPLDAGDFSLIDRKVIKCLNSLHEKNRFVRGIRSWVGFKQIGLEYERDQRYSGEPKYTFSKLLKLASDGIFSFSFVPLRITLFAGLVLLTIGLISLLYTFIDGIFSPHLPSLGFILLSIVLFLGGIQLIGIGVVGEYLGRVYDEVKGRPLYITKEMVGFEQE